ncbi:MAG: gamma-glutamylcyclotransferase [Alphaproteobacteria bacterium]|nr:gamma-glutamylcyclotransferase [Alphaproteobacteria bacterium]
MHKVFVYGTLKRGFANHDAGMSGFAFIGRVRTIDAYPLVIGGRWFSRYLIPEPGVGHRVFGEAYGVDDRGLLFLDDFEGAGTPNGYRRIQVSLEGTDDGATFDAWTYGKDRAAIAGTHSAPMTEYLDDSQYVPAARRSSRF